MVISSRKSTISSKKSKQITERLIMETLKYKIETNNKKLQKLIKFIKKDPTYKECKVWVKELSHFPKQHKSLKKSKSKSKSKSKNRTTENTSLSVMSGGSQRQETAIHRTIRLSVWLVIVFLMLMGLYFEPTHSTIVVGLQSLYNDLTGSTGPTCRGVVNMFWETLGISNPICYHYNRFSSAIVPAIMGNETSIGIVVIYLAPIATGSFLTRPGQIADYICMSIGARTHIEGPNQASLDSETHRLQIEGPPTRYNSQINQEHLESLNLNNELKNFPWKYLNKKK